MTIEEKQDWRNIIHRCFRCGYCKFTKDFSEFNCPSYKKYRFETYSTGGRLWLIYGILSGEINWNEGIVNAIYACTTCGNCTENCRFDKFKDFLVDFIEAGRALAVENGFCPENQKILSERTENHQFNNPYGEPNSDNIELKKNYNLPDEAEWVYFIGCTSNYRQKNLRDATIRFLKKAKLNFTLIDEHCCLSPLLRTGQTKLVRDFMNYNINQINKVGANKVITSCAGCYRTMKKDWLKLDAAYRFEVYHTVELIKKLFDEDIISINSEFPKTVTYHDPCHLGRHMGIYELPREVYNKIPGIKLVEMRRNRENAWCCGAGGGVKIGYPEWSLEVSKERLEEAKEKKASVVSSICPFCRTNLTDANEKYKMELEVMDLLEILDTLDYSVNK
ncbi:MAG: (Fe-S)-binding protein [Candidatus Hermodarchaeota archaeon]